MSDTDRIVFSPDDVDLTRSPLRRGLDAPTRVLGAFNPGLTRLPGGNLLLMVRVAEALAEPVSGGSIRSIRWTAGGYRLDAYPVATANMTDPRQFALTGSLNRVLGLTSLSWLLPVELDPEGRAIRAIHYDRAIAPAADWQCLGVEDARISRVGDRYLMTVCSVSPAHHGTSLYTSDNGLDWHLEGLILDHQNKDMLIFEGLVGGMYWALTRPLGDVWFATPPDNPWAAGPSINLARSPDSFHWKPLETAFIRPRKNAATAMKVGGGTPPVLTPEGWLMIYHGVEQRETVGVYRSFWALLDRDDPARILRLDDETPLLEADAALTAPISHRLYLPTPVVFSTGIVADGDDWLVASGEADLACRLTRIPKSRFL